MSPPTGDVWSSLRAPDSAVFRCGEEKRKRKQTHGQMSTEEEEEVRRATFSTLETVRIS